MSAQRQCGQRAADVFWKPSRLLTRYGDSTVVSRSADQVLGIIVLIHDVLPSYANLPYSLA
jgi:hypothetical protein